MAGHALPASSLGLAIDSFAMVGVGVFKARQIYNGDWKMRRGQTSRSIQSQEPMILQQGEMKVEIARDAGQTSGLL